jgi:hypothetical protein
MEAPEKVQTLNIGAELEKDRNYLTSRGATDDFVDQVFQAGHADIWFPSRTVLLSGGIITGE